MVKVKGIKLELNGDFYIVPPLPLGALEAMQERIQDFTGGLDKESVATVIDCLHASLKRNYPELTRDAVADLVDVANMGEAMQAVMDVSGMHRKKLEAEAADLLAKDTGVDALGNQSPSTTGGISTPESSPLPDIVLK